MSKRKACDACDGFGDDRHIADLPCRSCNGTGFQVATDEPASVPLDFVRCDTVRESAPRVVETERRQYYACPECSGTGEGDDVQGITACRRCNGNGSLTVDRLTIGEVASILRGREADDEMRNNVDFGD